MASFAEYPSQNMASNNHDFTLYPYQDMWNNDQTYLTSSTYADQQYLNATTFDDFQAAQAYGQPDPYSYGTSQSFSSKNNLPAPSSNYSPANSASHSFELQQPPVLSSTSDSGASAHSTMSSAMASPSMQPQPSNEWIQQEMNIIPGIVQQDNFSHDVFATTGFDFETIPVTDKGCVGELSAISSSQQSRNVSPIKFPSFPTPFDCLRDSNNFASFPANGTWSNSMNMLPATRVEIPPSVASSLTPHSESISPSESVFKSPSTPASATSPVLERVRGKRQASVALPAPKRARGTSPLTQAMSYDESDLPARPNAPPPTFTSPFFSQSSGSFVPPLELSCPSPTPTFRTLLFSWSLLWLRAWNIMLT